MNKLDYLVSSIRKKALRQELDCPSCQSTRSECISRKYLFTELRRCTKCKLLFRCPTDSEAESFQFYQSTYDSGFTTDLPSETTLHDYLSTSFKGTPKDFSRYINIIDALVTSSGARVLDFGASWGYGTWQLVASGYDAIGYELSRPRASYGRDRLNVPLVSELSDVEPGLDIVFSSHVLEHIPNLDSVLTKVLSLLKPEGVFVAITPNGTDEYRRVAPQPWQRSWGLKHPLLLDADYWEHRLSGHSFFLTSQVDNLECIRDFATDQICGRSVLNGPELLVLARTKIPDLHPV